MATKVTIIGESEVAPKKKIEFVKYLSSSTIDIQCVSSGCNNAGSYKHIELICKDYGGGYDLMFVYQNTRGQGALILGYFNDGVV